MNQQETKLCNICNKRIIAFNFTTHQIGCEKQYQQKLNSNSKCPYCNLEGSQWSIEKHVENCLQNMFQCEFCQKYVPIIEITQHEDSCEPRKFVLNLDREMQQSGITLPDEQEEEVEQRIEVPHQLSIQDQERRNQQFQRHEQMHQRQSQEDEDLELPSHQQFMSRPNNRNQRQIIRILQSSRPSHSQSEDQQASFRQNNDPFQIFQALFMPPLNLRIGGERRENQPQNLPQLIQMLSILGQLGGNVSRERGLDNQESSVLPKVRFKNSGNLSEENKRCVICLTDFSENEEITIIPCMHRFHEDCLKGWIKQHESCPICKKSIRQMMSQAQ